MPTARLGLACSVVDDKVYVFGGSMMAVFSPALKNNEVYLPFGYGHPEQSSAVQELSLLVILPLIASIFAVIVIVWHRKS